jgi:O-antigen/teichoic acid export membrane protein
VILVAGVAASLDLLLHPQPASLRARSFFFVPDAIEVATYATFKLGLVLYLARSGLSTWTLALLILADSIVRKAAISGAGLWLCDWTRRIGARAVDGATLRTLAVYGGGTFLINIGELIRFQLDSAVIGFFLSSAQITVYSIGMRLVQIAYHGIGVIGAVLIPRFSGLHERGDRQGYDRLLRRANLATDLVIAYFLSNIAVFGRPFLKIWIGMSWVDDAFAVTLVMLPAYFVALLTGPAAGLLMGSGKLRGLGTLTLVEAGANLLLSIALVRPLGIYGVCLGTAIPMIVFRGVVFPFVLRAQVGVSVGAYYRSHLKGVGLAVVYAALLLPVSAFPIDGWIPFVLGGAATTVAFAALALMTIPELRDKLVERLRRARTEGGVRS